MNNRALTKSAIGKRGGRATRGYSENILAAVAAQAVMGGSAQQQQQPHLTEPRSHCSSVFARCIARWELHHCPLFDLALASDIAGTL
jgi:hypothetical protein